MYSRPLKTKLIVALTLTVILAGCGDDDCPTAPTVPEPKLDAHFEPETTNLGSGVGGTDKALTFVVQQTGFLQRIELYVNQPSATTDPLLVDIRATSGGVPLNNDGDLMAITVVEPPEPGEESLIWVVADFGTAGPAVTEGDVLAIGVRSSGSWTMVGRADDSDPTSRSYFRNPSQNINTWSLMGEGSQDVGYRVYVLPE